MFECWFVRWLECSNNLRIFDAVSI
jgi:hypothetical protein